MGRIKFGVYKAQNTSGKEQQSCARVISKGTMRMEDICEYLSDSCSLTSADVKGAIEALTTYIGRNLSNGYCVELEGLGHFSPALKTLQKTDEKGRTVFFARADGVNFRCSKRLKTLVTDSELKNKIEYIIAVISEFAAAHSLNTSQAYRYLERFKGIDFVNRFYNVEHTLSFEDVVEDLTAYCHRKGGALV